MAQKHASPCRRVSVETQWVKFGQALQLCHRTISQFWFWQGDTGIPFLLNTSTEFASRPRSSKHRHNTVSHSFTQFLSEINCLCESCFPYTYHPHDEKCWILKNITAYGQFRDQISYFIFQSNCFGWLLSFNTAIFYHVMKTINSFFWSHQHWAQLHFYTSLGNFPPR